MSSSTILTTRINVASFLVSTLEATFSLGYMAFLIKSTGHVANANLLIAAFWGAMVIAELPTGYLSDRWGAKKALLIALALRSGAFFLFYISSGQLALLLIANILAGSAVTFLTGVYTMQLKLLQSQQGLKVSYEAFAGQASRLRHFGFFLGTLLGTTLMTWVSLRAIWMGAIGLSFLTYLYVYRTWPSLKGTVPRHLLQHVVQGWKKALSCERLMLLLVFNACLLGATLSHMTNWIVVYAPGLHQDALALAIITASLAVVKMLSSWLWETCSKLTRLPLVGLSSLTGLCMLLTALPSGVASLSAFLIFTCLFTWLDIRLRAQILAVIPAHEAGIISAFQSLFENTAGFLGYVLLGYGLKHLSVLTSWWISGTALLLMTAVFSVLSAQKEMKEG